MTALHELSAVELAAAIRHGEVSCLEVAQYTLARAERISAMVGAFSVLAPERTLEQARRADQRLAEGDPAPLLGVPCPIKELNAVAGLPWQAGSAALRGEVADFDDDIVGWFADAGTVLVGKTAAPEFGLPCYTEPDGLPPARTPWDLTRSAGGSSGGAAAAVAAGIVPMAHGSDGGGSIRIPASSCGLVGLKPSRGLISPGTHRTPGPGLTTDGVLTRTVADTAAALDVLAGPRLGETYWSPMPSTGFTQALGRPLPRLRIGVLGDPVIAEAEVHPGCLRALSNTAAALAGLGHHLESAPVPFAPARWQAFKALWGVGAAQIPLTSDQEAGIRPLTRWLREIGATVSGTEYADALAQVQQLTLEVARAWDRFDIVMTPTLAQPPARIGALRNDDDPAADFAAQTRFTPWTSVHNLSGRPAISLPLHHEPVDGVDLPFGVMFAGRFGEDALVLQLAAELESALGWSNRGLID